MHKALFAILIGAILAIIGGAMLSGEKKFLRNSEPAELVVIAMNQDYGSGGDLFYYPVFGINTDERPRVEYTSTIGYGDAPHAVGEIVPGRHRIETGELNSNKLLKDNIWAFRICFYLGLFMIAVGVINLVLPSHLRGPFRIR